MRFQEKCIECSKRQGIRIYNLVLKDQGQDSNPEGEDALRQELDSRVDCADPSLSPAELSLIAIRAGEKHAQCGDPFVDIKQKNNELALSLYPELQERLRQSGDPLHLACQLAACGNIIDLGIHEDFDIHATIEKVIREGFQRDDYNDFVDECNRLHSSVESPFILYICDNAGEIVFDRLFIETIQQVYPNFRITAVVRGKPVLNDATMIDAKTTGLVDIVPVIDNGRSELGTVIEKTGKELREAFQKADLIISKGQANFETLCDRPENIYFILKAKCDVIAESLGVKLWDAVVTHLADNESSKPVSSKKQADT